MDKQKADEIITEYMPRLYGFAVRKSFSYAEAEEICSDIICELYSSLLMADEVCNIDGYICRISEHVYSRYVSSKKKHQGISIDEMEIPFEENFSLVDTGEEVQRLHREIAFLTKICREIVYSFYYENKAISAISNELGLPAGTVKWHLNKARNELKERVGMERRTGMLGMKPIRAVSIGHSGTIGANGGPEYYLDDNLKIVMVIISFINIPLSDIYLDKKSPLIKTEATALSADIFIRTYTLERLEQLRSADKKALCFIRSVTDCHFVH